MVSLGDSYINRRITPSYRQQHHLLWQEVFPTALPHRNSQEYSGKGYVLPDIAVSHRNRCGRDF